MTPGNLIYGGSWQRAGVLQQQQPQSLSWHRCSDTAPNGSSALFWKPSWRFLASHSVGFDPRSHHYDRIVTFFLILFFFFSFFFWFVVIEAWFSDERGTRRSKTRCTFLAFSAKKRHLGLDRPFLRGRRRSDSGSAAFLVVFWPNGRAGENFPWPRSRSYVFLKYSITDCLGLDGSK